MVEESLIVLHYLALFEKKAEKLVKLLYVPLNQKWLVGESPVLDETR